MSDYIPEYAKHGKGKTTIGHVLAHRSGVPGLPKEVLEVERLNDREFIMKAICDSKPFVPPGTMLAYHAASGGFILGEIVNRVTGKSIRDVLAEEILRPLSFRWGNWGVAEADIEKVGRDYVTGARLLPRLDADQAGAQHARRPTDRALPRSARPHRGDPERQRGHHRQ